MLLSHQVAVECLTLREGSSSCCGVFDSAHLVCNMDRIMQTRLEARMTNCVFLHVT